jgi:hypothetical protein
MRKYSVSILIILLCISWFIAFPCKAATMWSDDFNDGNYEGWTVSGASNPWNPGFEILEEGSFSATNKALQATGDPDLWSWASHPSTVATGTWRLDIYLTSGTPWGGMGVTFILDKPIYTLPLDWHGYELDLMDNGELVLLARDGSSYSVLYRSTFPRRSNSWIHIDVTRDVDGRFCVYANGTLRIDVVDKRYTTSGYFLLGSQPGPAIDNVVVSNTVDIEPPTIFVPFYMQTWFLASVGVVTVAAVVIVAFLKYRKR